jgi:regulator of cell morphogenesis and NO signaling
MLNPDQTVASLVLDHSECAPIFQSHHIDFCCRGDLTIKDACLARGIDHAALLQELARAIAERTGRGESDPRTLSTRALLAHIVADYHEPLCRCLPFVEMLASKVSRVHGNENAHLVELDAAVRELAARLVPHIEAEEQVLFPALLAPVLDRALIAAEFASMLDDHLALGALLDRIRNATEDFRVPDWACNSYEALFSELQLLEERLRRHVHLENHVLRPRFSL